MVLPTSVLGADDNEVVQEDTKTEDLDLDRRKQSRETAVTNTTSRSSLSAIDRLTMSQADIPNDTMYGRLSNDLDSSNSTWHRSALAPDGEREQECKQSESVSNHNDSIRDSSGPCPFESYHPSPMPSPSDLKRTNNNSYHPSPMLSPSDLKRMNSKGKPQAQDFRDQHMSHNGSQILSPHTLIDSPQKPNPEVASPWWSELPSIQLESSTARDIGENAIFQNATPNSSYIEYEQEASHQHSNNRSPYNAIPDRSLFTDNRPSDSFVSTPNSESKHRRPSHESRRVQNKPLPDYKRYPMHNSDESPCIVGDQRYISQNTDRSHFQSTESSYSVSHHDVSYMNPTEEVQELYTNRSDDYSARSVGDNHGSYNTTQQGTPRRPQSNTCTSDEYKQRHSSDPLSVGGSDLSSHESILHGKLHGRPAWMNARPVGWYMRNRLESQKNDDEQVTPRIWDGWPALEKQFLKDFEERERRRNNPFTPPYSNQSKSFRNLRNNGMSPLPTNTTRLVSPLSSKTSPFLSNKKSPLPAHNSHVSPRSPQRSPFLSKKSPVQIDRPELYSESITSPLIRTQEVFLTTVQSNTVNDIASIATQEASYDVTGYDTGRCPTLKSPNGKLLDAQPGSSHVPQEPLFSSLHPPSSEKPGANLPNNPSISFHSFPLDQPESRLLPPQGTVPGGPPPYQNGIDPKTFPVHAWMTYRKFQSEKNNPSLQNLGISNPSISIPSMNMNSSCSIPNGLSTQKGRSLSPTKLSFDTSPIRPRSHNKIRTDLRSDGCRSSSPSNFRFNFGSTPRTSSLNQGLSSSRNFGGSAPLLRNNFSTQPPMASANALLRTGTLDQGRLLRTSLSPPSKLSMRHTIGSVSQPSSSNIQSNGIFNPSPRQKSPLVTDFLPQAPTITALGYQQFRNSPRTQSVPVARLNIQNAQPIPTSRESRPQSLSREVTQAPTFSLKKLLNGQSPFIQMSSVPMNRESHHISHPTPVKLHTPTMNFTPQFGDVGIRARSRSRSLSAVPLISPAINFVNNLFPQKDINATIPPVPTNIPTSNATFPPVPTNIPSSIGPKKSPSKPILIPRSDSYTSVQEPLEKSDPDQQIVHELMRQYDTNHNVNVTFRDELYKPHSFDNSEEGYDYRINNMPVKARAVNRMLYLRCNAKHIRSAPWLPARSFHQHYLRKTSKDDSSGSDNTANHPRISQNDHQNIQFLDMKRTRSYDRTQQSYSSIDVKKINFTQTSLSPQRNNFLWKSSLGTKSNLLKMKNPRPLSPKKIRFEQSDPTNFDKTYT